MPRRPDLRHLWAVPSALLALACCAPAAVAQEEGVHVDPGSPTGKEYAIPFDTARREAAPSGGRGAVPGAAPLFGAGIVASASGGGDGGSGGASATDAPAATGGSADDGGGEPAADPAASGQAAATLEAATQNPGAPDGGIDSAVIVGLLTAGLLVAGGLAGVLVRRTRG